MQGRLDEAARVMGGVLLSGSGEGRWRGAALDSRKIAGGELFFALPGERSDGHRFVADAQRRGAAGAVVHAPVEATPEGGLIEVDDTFAALHALTRWARDRAPRRLVAVTGSAGKTTTKELAADMLARRFRTARSPGNLNNLYGFPLALLGIPEETEVMVAEMGMSRPGELGGISRLGRPDVAVFTNVRPAHLEGLGSLEAVAEAKAELLEGLAPDGVVVANHDDAQVRRIADRHSGRVIRFGLGEGAEIRAAGFEPDPGGRGSRFTLVAGGREQPVELALHGRYNVENFLAAAACALHFGVSPAEIAEVAASATPVAMRGVVHRLPDGSVIIDDSYNSNPSGLAEALASSAELSARRRWAVLGDMLELGPESARYHREAGTLAGRLGFSPVVGVGSLARELTEGAREEGAEVLWVADAGEASRALAGRLERDDLVLVKGSRGIGLELVVKVLLEGREGGVR